MIRINLLPQRRQEAKKTKTSTISTSSVSNDYFPYIFGSAAGASILVILIVFGILSIQSGNLENQLTTLKNQNDKLRVFAKEFQSLEKQKKEISAKLAIVDKIKEGRAVAPRILYDLSSLVKENLWFKRLVKDDTKLEIEGRSVDNETLCTFVEQLAKLPYLRNIELKTVEDVTESDITVKKFIVQGSITL